MFLHDYLLACENIYGKDPRIKIYSSFTLDASERKANSIFIY